MSRVEDIQCSMETTCTLERTLAITPLYCADGATQADTRLVILMGLPTARAKGPVHPKPTSSGHSCHYNLSALRVIS